MKRATKLLEEGVRAGVFPGAVLLAAKKGDVSCFRSVGSRALRPRKAPMSTDTIFDLASLTKPLSTTLALMRLVDKGLLDLDEPLARIIREVEWGDKGDITPRLLLCHRGGLPDWRPYFREVCRAPRTDRKRRLRECVLREPLAHPPGSRGVYSDLGFILLEWVAEKRAGIPLHRLVEQEIYRPLGLVNTFLYRKGRNAPGPSVARFAATEQCPWRKRVLCGEVHDENAWAAGGYSGHAGLFGTAEEVYSLADLMLGHYQGVREDFFRAETVRAFLTQQESGDGSTWALGWDTPSPEGSSAGRYFSRESVGHLGFTGTSLWVDLEQSVIMVFLTNRVHPTRNNEAIRAYRPLIHDAVMEDLSS